MWPGVPRGNPVRVKLAPPAVLMALAMPKSATIGWPCEKRMFSGLMSRCNSRGGFAMHRTYLLCLALLASGAARAHAQSAADSAGIRATAHDYLDRWYEGY